MNQTTLVDVCYVKVNEGKSLFYLTSMASPLHFGPGIHVVCCEQRDIKQLAFTATWDDKDSSLTWIGSTIFPGGINHPRVCQYMATQQQKKCAEDIGSKHPIYLIPRCGVKAINSPAVVENPTMEFITQHMLCAALCVDAVLVFIVTPGGCSHDVVERLCETEAVINYAPSTMSWTSNISALAWLYVEGGDDND